ncbi:polymeric immunoglobulin receptor-like [Alosa sapidissima]|uniref:polymeric immunoglobulin receptor-like n=1 Tax=Alosa sapidissima TaxID=34773 RepID=UPI001C091BB7|nr:polymeric immunoglobulin receptor-like [Alosa sapidissima]
MKRLIYFLFFFYLSTDIADAFRVIGYVGRTVNIKCVYENKYENNNKYFCKGRLAISCTVQIETPHKNQWVNGGRFSLYDNTTGGFFMVIFRDLTLQDTGRYHCAVKKPSIDKSEVAALDIKSGTCCVKPLTIFAYEGETVNISCRYPNRHLNTPKFFCRHSADLDCKYRLVTQHNQVWVSDGRLALHDNREDRILTVTLKNSSIGDSGSYRCGVEMERYSSLITNVELNFTTWCCEQHLNVTEFSDGDTAFISCPYPQGFEDEEKFFCRGERRDNCSDQITVSETGVCTVNGRFSALDNTTTRSVKVTIKDLRPGDSGTYWCGFDRLWRPADYTRVVLSVGSRTPSATDASQTTSSLILLSSATSSSSSSDSGLVIPVSVSAAVLVMIIIILIIIILIWRSRINKTNEPKISSNITMTSIESNKQVVNTEASYDDVEDVSPYANSGTTESTLSTVYATAQLPTALPDNAIYSNTQLTTQLAGAASRSDGATYAFIQHPDQSADTLTYASCMFNESTHRLSAIDRDKDDSSCDYASVKPQSTR